MKQKLSTAFAVFALLLVGLGSQSYAGTYASSLRTSNPDTVHAFDGSFTDGTGVLLWYTLNGPADTVLATVWWNGTAIMAFKADSTGAGSHNFLWDGKDSLGHYVGVGQYAFTVWTYDKGNPDTVWKQVWQNDVYGDHVTNALSSRDMAIVNDPMSPGFGDLFLSESTTYYGYARMIAARSDGSFIGAFGASNFPQGTVNTDPWYLTTAGDHSLYVTSLTLNSIFVFNDSAVVKVIQDTVHFKNPAGIAAHGAPVPTLYLATGRAVIRGTPTAFLDTLFAVDTVGGGPNGGYVRDVAVDDSGYVYISFGPTSGSYAKILHLSPTGVPIDTVTLPGNVTHLQLFYGTSRTTNADDILYARVPGSAGGVFKVNFATKTATKLFTPSTSSSSYHSITVDMFGDIYYANPSAEWVRMYAPPKSGPFTFTSQPHPVNVFAGAATKVMDNFESGVGHFGKSVTYSGSTVGVSSSSTATLNTTDGHLSGQSMQLVLADDPSSHANWEVRFLSGGGTPSNNDSIGATGWVGFWAKTVSAPPGAMVSIGLDDPSDPYTKRAMLRPVINDGAWHLYEWDIADSMQWTAWVVTSGSSKIKGPRVSVDAVWFFAPDGAPNWTVNFDDVSYNASGMIGIDAGTGDVTGNGTVTALDASWMLQYAVGLRQFSAMQKQIGDVNLSSNGLNVNAFDAALTLAHVVGQVMLPFTGTLPVHLTGSTDPVPAKAVSLSPVSGKTGQIISIPVFVDANVAGIRSAQMKLVFDDSQLRVRSVSITELTKDFALASNIQNGSVAIAMANGNELTHGGQLLTIEAEIVGSGDNIVVSLEDIRLNDNSISSVTSVGTKDDNIPSTYELSQNYPNPFNPSTTIEYKLPQRAFVEMKIYDITGREVATLVSAMQEPGTYRVVWNATNGYGVKVASGVYFYRITAGNFTQLKKMLLLK